jgi:hypothetical protein
MNGQDYAPTGGFVCDPDRFVTVTVSVYNGETIRVALGSDPDANIFMSWTDPDPTWKVNYIAVMSM